GRPLGPRGLAAPHAPLGQGRSGVRGHRPRRFQELERCRRRRPRRGRRPGPGGGRGGGGGGRPARLPRARGEPAARAPPGWRAAAVRLGCCGYWGPVAAADLDLDGDNDLVLEGIKSDALTLMALLQGRPGEFRSAPISIAELPADHILAVDLSGDSLPDLLGV